MTTFRDKENQADNEILALIHAGLHGHNTAWHEVLKRDKPAFAGLQAQTENVDAHAFADLQSIPYAYENLEVARKLGQALLNEPDAPDWVVDDTLSLSDPEDLHEFLPERDLSDAVHLIEALGEFDHDRETEDRIAYGQMMRDVL